MFAQKYNTDNYNSFEINALKKYAYLLIPVGSPVNNYSRGWS